MTIITIDIAEELDARGIKCDLEKAKDAIEDSIRIELENHFSDMLENGGVEFKYVD
jgi:hypothetical protein